jgi:hypothetical protein
MGRCENVWFVLFIYVGATQGAKMGRIKNIEGGGALAFHGCRFNNKYNNQPKFGIIGGYNIRVGAQWWHNLWEGHYPIDSGSESGNEIIEKKYFVVFRGN